MAESWSRLRDSVANSQSTSDEMAEELESEPSPGQSVAEEDKAWWVHHLLQHTSHLSYQPRTTPLKLLSGCTGSFAEGAVLQDRVSGHRAVRRRPVYGHDYYCLRFFSMDLFTHGRDATHACRQQ